MNKNDKLLSQKSSYQLKLNFKRINFLFDFTFEIENHSKEQSFEVQF